MHHAKGETGEARDGEGSAWPKQCGRRAEGSSQPRPGWIEGPGDTIGVGRGGIEVLGIGLGVVGGRFHQEWNKLWKRERRWVLEERKQRLGSQDQPEPQR